MDLQAKTDVYGNPVNLTSKKLRDILDALDNYYREEPYTIWEIRQDSVKDKNDRYDIEIGLPNRGLVHGQKLLFLNGELIDGKAFHKRYNEWYKDKETEMER